MFFRESSFFKFFASANFRELAFIDIFVRTYFRTFPHNSRKLRKLTLAKIDPLKIDLTYPTPFLPGYYGNHLQAEKVS